MQERHPSALDRFDALAAAAQGKQVAVFLDYDGTLSPIVEDPDRAVMTDEVRAPRALLLLLSDCLSCLYSNLRWTRKQSIMLCFQVPATKQRDEAL